MKRKLLLASTPLFLSMLCITAYAMIGSSVAPDGTLQEPFFLIPIGYLFFFIGSISLLYVGIAAAINKKRRA